MKIKFVTCIYNNLYGTDFGGRPSREYHYKYSLLSILKMDNATFVLYTSSTEYDELSKFFYDDHGISKELLEIKKFDLVNTKYYNTIKEVKNLEEVRSGDRCYEIQFSKFYWLLDELDDIHTYFFWIDAGLSHNGLFPPKYKIIHKVDSYRSYFDFSIFNNKTLTKLTSKTGDKIFLLAKDNTGINYWARPMPAKYFKNFDSSIHIVGGLFGGMKEQVEKYVNQFNDLLIRTLDSKELYFEEVLMSCLYADNPENYSTGYFQIWWYDGVGPYESGHQIYKDNIPFYRVFEQL